MTSLRPQSFGDLLKRYRLAAGLTQEALAERAGLSPKGISDLERGARHIPRKDTLSLLVVALHLAEPECKLLEAAARRPNEALVLPLAPWEPAASSSARPPLVGRTAELARLSRHLASDGPPLLLLAGEPGIGKSRLLQEVRGQAAAAGWTVLAGGCHRGSSQEPFAPLLEVLARTFQHQSLAQQRLSLQGCSWLVWLLPELAESGLVSAPGSLPPGQERRLLFSAVARYLANVAGPQGTLLVLDDLQWAGPDVLDLLTFVLRTQLSAPVRVVGTYRDTEVRLHHPLAGWLADLAREWRAERIGLEPLSHREALALLVCLLGETGEAGDELYQQVAQRAGGVPFYLVSYAQGLQAGALSQDRGGISLPWSVVETIRQRIVTLPGAAQEVLRLAAVVGPVMPRWILTSMTTWTERDLLEALEALDRARLLMEAGEETVAFAHDLIYEVILNDLGATRRSLLQRQVAELLDQQAEKRARPSFAYHHTSNDASARAEGARQLAVSAIP